MKANAIPTRLFGLAAPCLLALSIGRATAGDVQGELIDAAPARAVSPAKSAIPAVPSVVTPAQAALAAAPKSAAASNAASSAVALSLADIMKSSADTERLSHDTAGFDKLSAFPFKATDEMILGMADAVSTTLEINSQIPRSVKSLNEKEVTITGFMMPTKVTDGRATEFLLLKNRGMCCYGTVPALNEYVTVRMSGKGVKSVQDQLVTVSGTLRVGEIRENRLLLGIYQLNADKFDGPATP